MKNLLIEQRGPTGLLKTWRLRPEQGSATFGNSRHADLRSPSQHIKGIHGIFEYREGKWFFINLSLDPSSENAAPENVEVAIESPVQLQLPGTNLDITPYDARTPLLSTFDTLEISTESKDRKPFQFWVVSQGSTLLETKVLPLNQKFRAQHDRSYTKISAEKSNTWKRVKIGDLDIGQRTVYLKNQDEVRRISPGQYIDPGGKKSIVANLIAVGMIAVLFFIAPKSADKEKTLEPVTPLVFKDIKTPPPPKPKKGQSPTQEQKPVEVAGNKVEPKPDVAPAPAPAPAAKGTGKQDSTSKIKSLATGRISQLIGKVSAQAAKSANVVVASGVTAGSQPSGRALSAVGKVGRSGKDWAQEGKGGGIVVSTKGKAGGQGTGGLGTLAAGKTGQGGVGLLEEEGEIIGGLDREVIAQYIKSQLGQILYCYERQLSANPELYGKVAIKFTIIGNGGVELQRVSETTLKNATVEGCILQKVARWKFPAPEGGTKVLVTYPFLFKSTN